MIDQLLGLDGGTCVVSLYLESLSPVVLFVGVEDVLVLGRGDELALGAGPQLPRTEPRVGGSLVPLEAHLNFSEGNVGQNFLLATEIAYA